MRATAGNTGLGSTNRELVNISASSFVIRPHGEERPKGAARTTGRMRKRHRFRLLPSIETLASLAPQDEAFETRRVATLLQDEVQACGEAQQQLPVGLLGGGGAPGDMPDCASPA